VATASLAILSCGLVASTGYSAPAVCAAIRAKVSNPAETRFRLGDGDWLIGHAVAGFHPLQGINKLVSMASMAVAECLEAPAATSRAAVPPLILCVAERTRAGRIDGLDDLLFNGIEARLNTRFHGDSMVVPHGRIGVGIALIKAAELVRRGHPAVVVAGVDTMLNWPTLEALHESERLLSAENSDGFLPGEGASAVLVGGLDNHSAMEVLGVGTGVEASTLDEDLPDRADGLVDAIRMATANAAVPVDDLDYRITDLSGEQIGFREASLALTRTARRRKARFDLWHPAESIGEIGAAAGPALLVVADIAARKGYAPGPGALLHLSNDDGRRAALVTRSRPGGEVLR
jgi:3-oxoacyl-[acyl-carrier-protein] synthase-1